MDKVVILARVSTDKKEYQRQVNELRDYCDRVGWSVEAAFCNKISGAKTIEERQEIQDLISYVKDHEISRVVCLEISRLGRNTLEALRVIQTLNEHGVSLYVKNYNLETLNPDGKVNPAASLICTILLEIASMERLTIAEWWQAAGTNTSPNAVRKVSRWGVRQTTKNPRIHTGSSMPRKSHCSTRASVSVTSPPSQAPVPTPCRKLKKCSYDLLTNGGCALIL